MKIIILLSLLATTALAGPTVYKIDKEEGTAERVMTAVSSTGQSSRILCNVSTFLGISQEIVGFFQFSILYPSLLLAGIYLFYAGWTRRYIYCLDVG